MFCEKLLIFIGCYVNILRFYLDVVGVVIDNKGVIIVNEKLEINIFYLYVVGDCLIIF